MSLREPLGVIHVWAKQLDSTFLIDRKPSNGSGHKAQANKAIAFFKV